MENREGALAWSGEVSLFIREQRAELVGRVSWTDCLPVGALMHDPHKGVAPCPDVAPPVPAGVALLSPLGMVLLSPALSQYVPLPLRGVAPLSLGGVQPWHGTPVPTWHGALVPAWCPCPHMVPPVPSRGVAPLSPGVARGVVPLVLAITCPCPRVAWQFCPPGHGTVA